MNNETSVPARLPENTLSNAEHRFEMAQKIAAKLAASSLVPDAYRNRPEDVFVAIQMGHEVGLGPFQAVQSIAVIDNKPCLWGDGMIGLVRGSGKCEYIQETWDDATKTATCATLRKGEKEPQVRSFSLQDAALAQLTNKNNWKKYPARMCQMRARAWALRDTYADVLRGLASAEEVRDIQQVEVEEELPEIQVEAELAKDAPLIDDVIDDIAEAQTMADLIKAGDKAKSLWHVDDQEAARKAYKARRETLIKEAKDAEESADKAPGK